MVLRQNKSLVFEIKEGVSWWFVFCDARSPVLRLFCKKGHGHVFAFTEMQGVLICVEPLLGAVNISVTPEKAKDLITACKSAGYNVIFFRHPPQGDKLKLRSPIITCASYLAYTVGFPFLGVTPYQLYKKLMRRGAEIV